MTDAEQPSVTAAAPRWSGASPTAIVSLAAAAALTHAWSHLPFFSDDAFISLRYARRLLDGAGLTWNDGERVEGYSNLLWVLAVAALGWTGMDLVTAARVLGVALTLATLGAAAWAYRRTTRSDPLPPAFALFALAAAGPVAVWAVGGLEQPLFLAATAWATVLVLEWLGAEEVPLRRAVPVGLLWAAVVLTRPDGPLLVVATAAGVAWARPRARGWVRATAAAVGIAAAAGAAQLAFRLVYYDDWIPNTARIKVAWSAARLWEGLQYLGAGYAALAGVAVLALLGPFVQASPRLRVLAVPVIAWSAYVAFLGGDIFAAHRQLAVPAFLLAIGAADALAALRRAWPRTVLAAGALAALVVAALVDPKIASARVERWEWDCKEVAETVGAAFRARDVLIAVEAAGCYPYFSRLRSLDMLGLNDRYLARRPPPDLGAGELAHEFGDPAYVLERRPDIVFFGVVGSAFSNWRAGLELARSPAFRAEYAPLVVLGGAQRTRAIGWFRVEGRAGIERHATRVWIPGWFLAGVRLDEQVNASAEAVAVAEGAGGLVGAMAPGAFVVLPRLRLPPGRWAVVPEIVRGRGIVFEFAEGKWKPVRPGAELLASDRAPLLAMSARDVTLVRGIGLVRLEEPTLEVSAPGR